MTYPNPEPIEPLNPTQREESQIHEYTLVDGINDIKELLKEQILLLKSLQKDPYPIGSLYWTTIAENPATYFGGIWVLERILTNTDSDHYLYRRIH